MQTVDNQYKPETESATMMGTCGTSVPELKSPADNSEEIKKTRKLLLSVISYMIAGVVIGFIIRNFQFPNVEKDEHILRIIDFGESAVLILFFGFGYWATYRYSALGLRVFVWLFGILQLIRFILILILIILNIMDLTSSYPTIKKAKIILFMTSFSTTFVINIVVCILILMVTVFVVWLTLKLARLIATDKSSIIQQI